MAEIRTGSSGNLLLDALSPQNRQFILSHAKNVSLPLRTPISRQDEPVSYAYFPLSGVLSIVAAVEEGEGVEACMVGYEGLVGGMEVLGPSVPHTQCLAQSDVIALRIPLSDLRRAFHESMEIRSRVLEYIQAQAFGLTQIAACHRLHNAEERLARWLLMVRDRIHSDELVLTQEFLGDMLGARRSTVNLVAGILHRSGFIQYSRGRVHILDHQGLEAAACSCYQVFVQLFRNLYSDSISTAIGNDGFLAPEKHRQDQD